MKRLNWLVCIGFIGLVGLTAACGFNFSTARITDATLCKSVTAKTEPVDKTRMFDPADKVIHCVVTLGNAPGDTKLKAKWIAVQVDGSKPNTQIDEANISAGGNANVVDFTLTNENGFNPGDYQVEIYLNPADEAGKNRPERTISFAVQGAKKSTSSGDSSAGSAEFSKTWFSTDEAGENTVSVFETTTTVLFCQALVKNVSPGTKIEARWFGPDNKEIDRANLVFNDKEGRVNFSLSAKNGFPPGEYKVELFVGNSADPSRTLPFSVFAEGN